MSDEPQEGMTINGQSPVDRSRRFWFVSRVVGYCLLTATIFAGMAGMGFMTLAMPVIELFVKSLLGLAMAIGMSYIGGSVVDYNGGFGNMFSRNNGGGGYQSGEYDGDSAPKG